MLDITNTRVFQMIEQPVFNADIANIMNGQGLVYKNENGVGKVGLVAAATNKFAGVAMAGYVRPTTLTQVDNFTTTEEAKQFNLTYVPTAETIQCYDTVSGKALTKQETEGSLATGEYYYDTDANYVKFFDAGMSVNVTYRITATLEQAREAAGDGYPGGYQIAQLNGTVGVISQGIVATDQFDIASDFTTDGDIYVDANGYFTKTQGSNVKVENARVIAAPGITSKYLVIRLM